MHILVVINTNYLKHLYKTRFLSKNLRILFNIELDVLLDFCRMIYLWNVVGIISKCVLCYFSEVRARHHGHGVAKNRNKRTPANRARLYDSLLQNYNVILRPVKEERDVINVTHSLGLMQILEFDVVKQLLTFTAMEHLVSSSYFAILNWVKNKTNPGSNPSRGV